MSASAEAVGISNLTQRQAGGRRGGGVQETSRPLSQTQKSPCFFSSLRVTNSFCIYLLSIANAPLSPSVLLSSCAQMASCAKAGLQRRRPALRRVVAAASRTSAQGFSPLRCIRSHRHKAFLCAGKFDLISFLFFIFCTNIQYVPSPR